MPRNINPGDIRTGSGKAPPADSLVLTGMTPPGAPPNLGQPGYLLPGMTLANARPGIPVPGVAGEGMSLGGGVASHLADLAGAHDASAISLSPPPDMFSSNVQNGIIELSANIAPRPPMLGEAVPYMTFSGIPDWGIAKLRDESRLANGSSAYPYYWTAPTPTTDWGVTGNDPRTDLLWNSTTTALVPWVPGSGRGEAQAGAFTTDVLEGSPIQRGRGVPLQTNGGNDYPLPITVSGTVFPADRGVLALIHWPVENTVVDFLAQDLLDRCVAAILLGCGMGADSTGAGNCVVPGALFNCDGAPGTGPASGSIFSVGLNADGAYDPFSFPGQATGQYNLSEIYTGVSDIDGSALPVPWNAGWVCTSGSGVPGPGQVRLGIDPSLDAVKPYGIPVLGSVPAGYNPAPPDSVTLNDLVAHDRIGRSLLETSNFFGYRLPYLKDYSRATGLKYTPRGVDSYATRETARYFTPQSPFEPVASRITTEGATDFLTWAGNYDGFDEDCWNWQIGRYRHSFYAAGSEIPATNLGSYWMIHFKKEEDFTAFVRDGKMPWDATDGYEIYGASLVYTTADDVADDKNLVNPITVAPWAPGEGPAPDYGYGSKSYHTLRSNLITVEPLGVGATVTNTFTWAFDTPGFTRISGVSYFVPLNAGPGWFAITDMDMEVEDAWQQYYRVDDNGLTVAAAPARLSSPCPAFLGVAPFAFEDGTYSLTGAPFGPLAERQQRIEVPFEDCGLNGAGAFSDANGPVLADSLTIALRGDMVLAGDVDTPAFSTDAVVTGFVRRPLVTTPIHPISATDGNGVRLEPQTTGGLKAGKQVLYHSTGWSTLDVTNGHYGNFEDPVLAPECDANLVTATKDVEERFLDETYRYIHDFAIGANPPVDTALNGPGMGVWNLGPIPVPVRAGRSAPIYTPPVGVAFNWTDRSFFQAGKYLVDLEASELQVAGMPYRNPSYNTAKPVQYPFPSAGVLLYPKTDYTTGFVPDASAEGGAEAQPDYSAKAGLRKYVRAFDVSFARDPDLKIDVVGQTLITLRIDGLSMEDFAYGAPGPGQPLSGISIMVKVPGLTSWMDLGRVDGDGPSKQDPAQDGAGCKVLGPNTFESTDPVTGMVYCQVKVNVGPAASLAWGQVVSVGPPIVYEVPVLVKVAFDDIAAVKQYDLTLQYTSPGVFVVGAKPGAAPDVVRGLCGIRVVHPTLVEVAP